MTPDEQRIAIAEACGIVIHDHWGPLYKTPKGIVRVCPDYLNDLNAMQAAEKVLLIGTAKQMIRATNQYTEYLCRILGCLDTALFQFAHATAAQRAEAFLRTIGKWEDAK